MPPAPNKKTPRLQVRLQNGRFSPGASHYLQDVRQGAQGAPLLLAYYFSRIGLRYGAIGGFGNWTLA